MAIIRFYGFLQSLTTLPSPVILFWTMQRTSSLSLSLFIFVLCLSCVRAGYFMDNLPSKHCLADPGRTWVSHGDDHASSDLVHTTIYLEKIYLEIDIGYRNDFVTPEDWTTFENAGRLIVQVCEMIPIHPTEPRISPLFAATGRLLQHAVYEALKALVDKHGAIIDEVHTD